MLSLFIALFLINLVILGIISSVNSFFLLFFILPWTLTVYATLCLKAFLFSAENELKHTAGKLYWFSKGSFQATLIAILNVIILALLLSDSNLAQFDQQFGPFSSIFVFLFLPLPGFLIFSLKGADQERLYNLLYQEVVQTGGAPEFILLTSDLLNRKERYTAEYANQLQKIRESAFQYIKENFQIISPYFDQSQPLRLNLESLAIFLTKKLTSPTINNS